MLPTEERVKELQQRFGVITGRYFGEYRFKNLNWYLGKRGTMPIDEYEWFCYGDIKGDEIQFFQERLDEDEVLALGWKELGPDQKWEDFFLDGEGPWLILTKDEVLFDLRRDIQVKCENPACPKGGRCRGLCFVTGWVIR